MEEKVAVTRRRAILEDEARHKAEAEQQTEEAELEQGGLPSKQKGQAECKWVACDCCVMQGFECQVSDFQFRFDFC